MVAGLGDDGLYNPSRETLQELAAELGTETVYGSLSFESAYRSRSSDVTFNEVDDHLSVIDYFDMADAAELADDHDMITIDFALGREREYVCRYHVPQDYARIALALDTLLERADADATPDFETYQFPDDDNTRILVRPEQGKTVVFGSDYTGEGKKSFLRNFMYDVKQDGGLGLHAGTKRVTIDTGNGLEDVGQIYFGLSGTGKSTLTSHGFGLEEPEYVEMLQDDVVALMPDGSVLGTEASGLYAKTEGLTDNQEELYDAVTGAEAVLENVHVDEYGNVDFFNTDLTANGRAVIRRNDLASAADDIDLPQADQVFFITRNTLMPPIAKLTPAQAAATFMLGESVETGAADETRKGEALRVVGFNPFIIGPPGEEGNRLLNLIQENNIESYVINTGDAAGTDITVDDTVTALRETTRGGIDWHYDEQYNMALPDNIEGLDLERFYPPEQLDDFGQEWERLSQDRERYLDQFDDLDEEIRNALFS